MKALSELISRLGTTKLMIPLGVVVLLLFIGTGALLVIANSQSSAAQQYLIEVSKQELLSQRLATYALGSSAGDEKAFVALKQYRDEMDASLKILREGSAEKGVASITKLIPETTAQLEAVEARWAIYRNQINTILEGKAPISEVTEFVGVIREFIPQLLAFSDEIVTSFVESNAAPEQIYIASRQLMLTQRIENNLSRVLAGGEGAATAADQFGRDAALFGRVMEGMIRGDDSLGIQRVGQGESLNKLREVAMLFSSVSEHVGAILELSPQLFEVKEASNSAENTASGLLDEATVLENQVIAYNASLAWKRGLAIVLGVIALFFLTLMGLIQFADTRRRLAVTTDQNRRNQRAILRLLDEMTNLADGDLTVHATVTEDITGAIADSVNYSIDALRNLVTTINRTAVRVSTAAEKSQTTALRLADASNNQAREIASASAAITDMADSIEQVSENAVRSAEVANKSVEIAHKGAETVRRSIDGMGTIREQIQETSKRIKRLGESSQEIGDIVSLINDIADQTNILALNAAIQASSAGEAGRGFAVVADEVQRLAERAANATRQIEGLVKTIQADTNEAVISMEQSTANVVSGARLAEDAGEALDEIEDVSGQLSGLINGIAQTARQQASVATNVSSTMNVIQEITMQTSEGTTETARSIGNLTDLANELRRSVSGFKLPEGEQISTVVLDEPEDDDFGSDEESVLQAG